MTRYNIAYWRAHSGAIAETLADFERLLPDQERILDPGHPDIQHTRDSIAHLRKRLRTQPDPPET
jgi:ubiquinone biosynthesis protein UbiJ